MAFSVILRRLVSTAVPRAAGHRYRGSPATAISRLKATGNLALFRQPKAWPAPAFGFPSHRNFSASSTNKTLKEGSPKHFPFKIKGFPGDGAIKLEYEGDTDTVTFTVTSWDNVQCDQSISFPTHRNFSASPDKKLLEVIDSEIQCTLHSNEQKQGCPEYFPFKIEDDPGENVITLTREYDGDTITVKVWNDFRYGRGDNGEEKSSELDVRVDKENGSSLEFKCTAFPHKIVIFSVSTKNPNVHHDTSEYHEFGYSDFKDLNTDLQKSFHEYLEVRGIRPSITKFLHKKYKYNRLRSRINKDLTKNDEDYLKWLNELKTVVEA